MGDKPLTIDELRERYGVPLSTVYQWNREGTGPQYMKIGKRVYYRPADVFAWEKSRVVSAGE
jgi:predicted DNA-binding transcriptional regulator AlpA